MNTAETITAIAAPCVIGLGVLLALGAAREWWAFSWSASLKVIPAAKRQPRTAVEVRVPGAVEPGAKVEKITTRRGTAS